MHLAETSVPHEEYKLVEIRIFLSADGGKTYPLELEVTGWRTFLPRVLQLDETRLSALATDPRAYGLALGEMLFAAEAVGDSFKQTLAAIEASRGALRLRLRIDPPELQTIAWERVLAPIGSGWQPLAADAASPFSRFVLAQDWERPAPVTKRPLRMLAVIASPANLEAFNLDPIAADERKALHELLDGLPGVAVTYLESGTEKPPTLNAIRAALAAGQHIVHFLCHGAAKAKGTALFLEGEDGAVKVVNDKCLLEAFALVKPPPLLCFLAACETAARGRLDAFVPLGPALVDRGASAVIAMSDRVGLKTAQLFTQQYYNRLLNHGVADLAMNEARILVLDQRDWGAPVLFSRLDDNQLIAQPEKAPARPRLQAPPPPATFVGRTEVLARLCRALMSQPDAQISVAIQGIGGQGKSTVARKLCLDLAKEFPGGVLWLEVGPAPAAGGITATVPGAVVDPNTPWLQGLPVDRLASQKSSIIGHIARELDLSLSDMPRLEERAAKVQRELEAGGRLLAVLDDLWDPDMGRWLMQEVLPNQRAVLITTRLLDVARALADYVEPLSVMNEAEGVEMLAGFFDDQLGQYDEAARQIVILLEGLPLALELAARLCEQGPSDLARLLRKMKNKPDLGVLVLGGQASRETNLEYTLSLSLQGLEPQLAERFRALGAFAPAPFDLAALASVWQETELDAAEEAARQLVRRALLARGEDRLAAGAAPEHPVFVQHALLHAYALALAQRSGEAETTAGRHAAYFKALPAERPEQGERFWLQVEHAWDWVDGYGLLDNRLAFMRSVRTFMQRLGWWQLLRQRTEQLLSALRKAGGRPEDEADMLTHLGVTFARQDSNPEALRFFNEAREIYETAGDVSGRVENLNCIGVAHRNLGEFQDALNAFDHAQLLLDANDPVGMGDTRLNIGMTLRRMGRYQEALEHLLFAEGKFTEAEEFGRLAVALNEIGEAQREMRQYPEALTYCRQALEYRKKTRSKGGIGVTLCSIGKIFQAQGNSQQALESYEQALPLLRQVGNRNGEAVTSFRMATIYLDLRDLEQAERLLVRTVELDEAIGGPDLENHRTMLEQVRSRLLNQSGEKAAEPALPINSTGIEGDHGVGLDFDLPVP